MAATYLDAIIATHRARAAARNEPWEPRAEMLSVEVPSLRAALSGPSVGVIAEVKRRSPSLGDIDAGIDASETARAYVAGGAVALSVLTDEAHFGGSERDLREARAAVEVPILRKDFTVSPHDVLDAAEMGASVVLLIVAALDPAELRLLHEIARSVGLEALVEVHDEAEADRALEVGADLIGVNQRDLHTFVVDPDRAARVARALPSTVTRVAESGLRDRHDVERAAEAGFDGVLIGESLIRQSDRTKAVQVLCGVPRRG